MTPAMFGSYGGSRANSFAYFGPGTGTSPLPIYLANFNGRSRTLAGDPSQYTGTNWTNATQVAQLSETGALTPETADQLVAASEELITTGETLGRDGQRMQETADQMLALIGQ